MVRVDPETGSFTPITGLEQGSFYDVSAAGSDLVEVRGPWNMQLVDISQPDAPVVRQGGTLWPINLEPQQLEMRDTGSDFMSWPSDLIGGFNLSTSLLWASPGALPTAAGSFVHDNDGENAWVSAGNYIYQLAQQGTTDFRVRRFSTLGLDYSDNQSISTDIDQIISTTVPSELDLRSLFDFDVDPVTGDVAIQEWRSDSTIDYSSFSVLSRFSIINGTYVSSFTLSPESSGGRVVAIHGDCIVTALHDRLIAVGPSGETLGSLTIDTNELYPLQILAVRGDLGYLAVAYSSGEYGVIVLRLPDLYEVGRYTTPYDVYSIAEVGKNLVFGMQSAVSVAAPFCPGAQDN